MRPDGVLEQWLQLHHISPREVESVIATIRRTFPYVSLWLYGGQGVVLGSLEPVQVEHEAEALALAFLGKQHRGDMDAARRKYDEFVASRLLTSSEVDALLKERTPIINTDWNRWIEYSTPRYNITDVDWQDVNLKRLRSYSAVRR